MKFQKKTRGGNEYRIYTKKGIDKDFPIVGVACIDDVWCNKTWTADGVYLVGKKMYLDLIPKVKWKPTIGKIYAFWDNDKDVFIIGILKDIDNNNVYYPYKVMNFSSRKHCRPLTKEERENIGD